MAQWIPYEWPVLDPWEVPTDDGGWAPISIEPVDLSGIYDLLDLILQELWKLDPEGMLDFGPGNDADAPVDGDPGGNTEPPINGGVNDDIVGFPPTKTYQQETGPTWRVIAARIAGSIDIQMMETMTDGQPGAILRGVTVPAECGTPYVGDMGTVWHLPDGTVVFIPAAPTPAVSTYVTAIGSTGETEAADTDAWEVYNDATVDTGLDFTMLARAAHDETGIGPLYGYYRTVRVNPRGAWEEVPGEVRVAILDWTAISGYNAAHRQILGHDFGVLTWHDTTPCVDVTGTATPTPV